MNDRISSPDVDDAALVAASPFNLARRARGGSPWGGKRHRYSEAEWVRDRLGRWVKYIGLPWQESWESDASGRETPTFAHGNVFDSSEGTTPRFKNRIVSPKLDDGSVIMEVGNSVRDLGRRETPGEDQWDSLPTELPDFVPDGESAFVRRNPDTMELVSDPAGKMGGRAVLTPEERARRAQIGEGPRARVGEEFIGGETDELNVPEAVPADEIPQWSDLYDDDALLYGWEGDPANPNELWDFEDPTLRLTDDGAGAIVMRDEADPTNPKQWTFDKLDPELVNQIERARVGGEPTDDELAQMAPELEAPVVPVVEEDLEPRFPSRPPEAGQVPFSQVWADRGFTPDDIVGWRGVPGDDSKIWSEDGIWALDFEKENDKYRPGATLWELPEDDPTFYELNDPRFMGLINEEVKGIYFDDEEDEPDRHLDEYGEVDELNVPATDDDVLSDEERAALEGELGDELDQLLIEEESTGGSVGSFPNIDRATSELAGMGWTPDPEYPTVLNSPDGRYKATTVDEALGQDFDSMFVEDKTTGQAALWDSTTSPDFSGWLDKQLSIPMEERYARGWSEPLPKYTGADDGLSVEDRAKAIQSNMFGTVDLENADDPVVAERNDRIKALMGELAKDENASLLQRYNDDLGGMVGGDAAADVLYEYGLDHDLGSPAEALPRLIDVAVRMVQDDPDGTGPSFRELLEAETAGVSNLPSGVSANNFDWDGEGINLGFAERVFRDMTAPGGAGLGRGGTINAQSLQTDYGVSAGDAGRFLDGMEGAGLLERDDVSGGYRTGPAVPDDWESVPAAVRDAYPPELGGGSNMDQPPFDQWEQTPTDELLPFEAQKFLSPDGEWNLFEGTDGAWQLVNDGSGEFHDLPSGADPAEYLDSVFGGGTVDELNIPEAPGVEDLGAPEPVGRYKPGAHSGERAGGGERRNWVSRPYGYRAADFRERDRRRAIEESVTEGAWDELNLPETPTRESVREAAVDAGVSDKTLQRIDTALTPQDIVDAVDDEPAVDELNLPGIGSDARVAVAKLLTQLGMLDDLDDPADPQPSASEEELEASATAAADSTRRLQMSLDDQFQEIMDYFSANKDQLDQVGRRNLEAVSKKKNADKRPKWQQFMEDLPRIDSLPDKRRKELMNMLNAQVESFRQQQMQAHGDEKKGVNKELADRFSTLMDSYMARNPDLELHEWSERQNDADGRLQGAEDVMATKTPPREYRYMDDYKDVADYSTPDQEARIQNAANTLGNVYEQAVDVFGKDPQIKREMDKIRDDFAGFMGRTSGGPKKDVYREALLERAINQARLVAGTSGEYPEVEAFRDQLLEIRAEGHGSSMEEVLADPSWDIPDEELQRIYDALMQFSGTGTNKGKDLRNAAQSIKDILPGKRENGTYSSGLPAGSPERWAALMRARNNLDIAHGEQTIPLMHALGVRPDPKRVRKLLNPKFALAPENVGVTRPAPRGGPWSQTDLDVITDTASQLRSMAGGDTSRNAGRYRNTAKLLDSAVRAYNDGDYGAFESISEVAMSHLSALGQDQMFQQLGGLRDARRGPENWDAKWNQLEADLKTIFGEVPTGQGISNPKSLVPTESSLRQKALGLIAEAAQRPTGSVDQRTKLSTALWLLNQANDPRDADLRDALGSYGPNGDLHTRQAQPYKFRTPGPANDARIARSQEITQRIKDEGMLSGSELQEAFGLTPERLDGLVEPLINSGILRLIRRTSAGPVYAMGPNYFVHDPVLEKDRPLTRQELDDMVMRELADVTPSPVSPKPVVSHAFIDKRIVKRNIGGAPEDVVIGLGSETTPERNVTAFWDALSGNWVLSTFPVGSWKTFGGPVDESGAEVRHYMSLDSLRYGLTALADLNRIPAPEPVVAAIDPEDVAVEVRNDSIDGTTVVVVVVDDSDDDDDDDNEDDDLIVVPVTDYLEPPPEFEEPVYPTQLPVFPPGVDQVDPLDRLFPVGEEEIL